MIKKTVSVLAAAVLLVCSFAGCGKKENVDEVIPVTTGETGVVKDEEFGNVYIDLTIDEFNSKGFAFGDSVNISFDNGRVFEDVPYYSGYYVPVGELLACGYPGYPHVVIARNYGASTWEEFEMTDSSKVTVTLNEKGKYIDIQELYALSYSDDRNNFDSDEQFANFRAVKGGNLREDFFFRSASPCDNQHCRAAYANRFAQESGIKFVLNLSDNEEKYKAHTQADDFVSEYYDSLYKDGNVLILAMNANYRSDEFAGILSKAFYEMSRHDGPCLIHCVEGKDRTGFACALLLALAGASANEIIDDYMITYANYYGITKENNPEKYNAILVNVNDFLYCLCGAEKGAAVDTLDLKAGAENYLGRGGLTQEQIEAVESYIVK